MKRLLSSSLFRGLLGLAFLELVVYFVAPQFGLNNSRGVLALVGLIGLVILALRAAVNAVAERRFSWSLLSQARKKGTSEELANLEEGFKRAFQELASKRQGKSIFRPDAASYLPWILIMGPAGSGKSTGLQSSGLRFTSLGRRVQGIGGTRDCEWWLSEEAIFLDTAGRYADHPQDHEEWLGFLALLKRYRPQRPLDAVVLQVGLDDLEHLSPQELEREALELQRRLNELMDRLEVHFPVYLVFSKCDRLDGFRDLLGTLPSGERARPWGFSLDVHQLGDQKLGDALSTRFQALVSALLPRVTPQLSLTTDRDARVGSLIFPHELARRLPSLQLFVEVLFEPSQHREQPWLTEVHFVSAIQELQSLPSLRHPDQPVSALLGAGSRGPVSTEAFFLPGLFARVVAQTRDKARPSLKAARRSQLTRFATLGLAAVLCTWSSCQLTRGYLSTSSWLTGLEREGIALIRTPMPAGDGWQLPELGAELTRQAAYVADLEAQEGGWLTDDAAQAAERLLQVRVDRAFVRPLGPRLEAMLQRAAGSSTADGSTAGGEEEAYAAGYLALKLDFVLARQPCSGANPEETTRWAADFVVSHWRELVAASSLELEPAQAERMQAHLARYFSGQEPSSLKLPLGPKQQASRALKEQAPSDEVLYSLVLANAGLLARERQLDRDRSLFHDPGLPLAYTPEGCGRFVEALTLDQEWWQCILDKKGQDADPKAREALYKKKYLEEHARWLSSLSLKKPVTDLGVAVEVMSNVVGPNGAELDTMLQVMAGRTPTRGPQDVQTQIAGPSGALGKAWAWLSGAKTQVTRLAAVAGDVNQPLCQEARLPFRGFDALLSEKANPAQEALKRYKKAVSGEGDQGGLRQRVKGIQSGGDRPGASLELVKKTLGAEGELAAVRDARSDLVARVRAYGEAGLPGLEVQLEQLEKGLWQVLLSQSALGLQNLWTNQVFNPWQDLVRERVTDEGLACGNRMKLLEERLLPFIDQNLAIFYADNNYRQPGLKDLGGSSLPLDGRAWSQNNQAIGVVNARLPCPVPAAPPPAGGGAPPPVEPGPNPPSGVSLDPGPGQETAACAAKVKKIRIDTGEKVFDWSSSRGRLDAGKPSATQQAQLVVWLSGDREGEGKLVASSSSYARLLQQLRAAERGRAREDDQATVRVEGLSCGGLTFQLLGVFPPKAAASGGPGGPGGAGAPVNKQWRRIQLPANLISPSSGR